MLPRPASDHPEGDAYENHHQDTWGSKLGTSNRIMVAAIIVLFGVVLFIILLHIYARCFWNAARLRSRSRRWSRRFRRRASRIRYFIQTSPQEAGQQPQHQLVDHGLDKTVLEALPMFIYTKTQNGKQSDEEEQEEQLYDCPVCLSEFEEKEACRRLPVCNHVFHTECIDMWFSSHSTCPLCRCSVVDAGDEKTSTTMDDNHSSSQQAEPASNAVAIQILQDEGPVLLNPQHQQQQQLESETATATPSNSSDVLLSSNVHDDGGSTRSFAWKQQQLVIAVPPRPGTSSFQVPSPSPSEGQRSPLSAHLRTIRRLLSREYSRATPEDACCEQNSPATRS